MDKFTHCFSQRAAGFILGLFTIKNVTKPILLGSKSGMEDDFLSSLKEQSLVRGMKVRSHLKILRITPGNWRMVGVA
ncbi:MAG: hypothetical protein EBT57_03820 [Verrucomicrobia bacterium]|nr:hypothetical protein [Verrucomicrobiota bacterium]